MIFVSNGSNWWKEFILGGFLPLKSVKKYIWAQVDFWFLVDSDFLDGF
jgi:hypothetical protein